MPQFEFNKPTSRGERRKSHDWRKAQAHTHNVASRRAPGERVDARCTRADCRRNEVT